LTLPVRKKRVVSEKKIDLYVRKTSGKGGVELQEGKGDAARDHRARCAASLPRRRVLWRVADVARMSRSRPGEFNVIRQVIQLYHLSGDMNSLVWCH
jgi:hypothetical protein